MDATDSGSRTRPAIVPLICLGLLAIFLFPRQSASQAQENTALIREVRVLELEDTGAVHPAGLVYSFQAGTFHLLEGQQQDANLGLVQFDAFGLEASSQRVASARLTAESGDALSQDPPLMAFDQQGNRLLILQTASREQAGAQASLVVLIEIPERADGSLETDAARVSEVRHFTVQQPLAMAVDPNSGALIILDGHGAGNGPRLIRALPQLEASSGHPDSFDNAEISVVDLVSSSEGLSAARHMAVHPQTGHIHLLSLGIDGHSGPTLYELSQSGAVIATHPFATFDLQAPQAMVFAPSGDLTDDPDELDLYVVDDAGAQGSIHEFTLSPLVLASSVDSQALAASLVRVTDMSQFSPPSPDPSGVAFIPHRGTLMAVDGEVNEMPPYFTGENVFEMSLSGSLIDTLTTISFSDEPVGIDINPNNRHLFISDDTGTRSFYELDPGSDGLYDTPDDTVTTVRTAPFGSMDPEGLAYDPASGSLYIIDGVNREVYHLTPGGNGVFDGVPPDGDDQVSNFDTLTHGLGDPEGIAFNPNTGTIFAVGEPNTTLFEFTTSGALIGTHDISAANVRNPAGLAFGPGSQNSSALNIYVVARGVDNDSDPLENDGMLYEFSLGQTTSTATHTATAGPTATSTATRTPTSTATVGPTPTSSNTPTPSNTPTNSPTPTNTPVTTNLTLMPAADARVLQDNPETNFGTQTRLSVDTGEESYLRFEVSGLTGTVASATLRIFATNGSSNGPGIYGTSNTWSETGITWNNRPAATTAALDNVGAIAADTWVEYELTGHITGNGTYNFVLLPDSSDGMTAYSREGPSPPQLVLALATGPTPSPTITASATSTPTPTVATATSTSTATSTATPSSTSTATASATATPTNTPLPATATATSTPQATATPTASATATTTPPSTSIATATATSTPTTVPATSTSTSTSSPTNTATATPSMTATPTNTPPATATPTPTATAPASGNVTLQATADARVLQSFPNTNFGTDSRLTVDVGEESYVRFDVSGVNGAIQNATVRLFVTNASTDGPGIYGTSNSWTETGITWNNRPGASTAALDNVGSIAVNTWAEYDVTAYVTGNGVFSFVLLPDGSDGVRFDARERKLPPELVITFSSGPGPSATPTTTPPPSTATATATSTASATPLSATATGTSTATATVTNTPTATNTPGPSATATSTGTPTNTATSTPTAPASGSVTLQTVADARVLQSFPNTNFGLESRLTVDVGEESYLRFEISDVGNPIQSATLRLFVSNASTDGPGVFGTSNSWAETEITWNNRPGATTAIIANSSVIATDTWAEFDVTSYVTGNGTYNFVLLPDSSDGVRFDSRERKAPPELVLVFGGGTGPTATPTSVASTPTATSTPGSGSVVFVGAGDIADCGTSEDELTAQLLDNIPGTVFTVGDNAYPNGTAEAFNNCYEPTWGRHKARTHPAVGDNEYGTAGALGYFDYFGAAAGAPGQGYYSFDLGAWHVIVLNSNCSQVGGCDPNSPQGQWLQADLALSENVCILAIHHEPLFSSKGGDADLSDFWQLLYSAGAEIVLSGHRHMYERFAPQTPSGVLDSSNGIRQFVIGTGGSSLTSPAPSNAPNSLVRNYDTHGVLKFTLHPTGYDWEFIPIPGQTFTDSGSATCSS